jgi:hypothetical protein
MGKTNQLLGDVNGLRSGDVAAFSFDGRVLPVLIDQVGQERVVVQVAGARIALHGLAHGGRAGQILIAESVNHSP